MKEILGNIVIINMFFLDSKAFYCFILISYTVVENEQLLMILKHVPCTMFQKEMQQFMKCTNLIVWIGVFSSERSLSLMLVKEITKSIETLGSSHLYIC